MLVRGVPSRDFLVVGGGVGVKLEDCASIDLGLRDLPGFTAVVTGLAWVDGRSWDFLVVGVGVKSLAVLDLVVEDLLGKGVVFTRKI